MIHYHLNVDGNKAECWLGRGKEKGGLGKLLGHVSHLHLHLLMLNIK